MGTAVSVFIPVLYCVAVVGICGFLLARGFTHTFLILFAVAALLRVVPPLGFAVMTNIEGGFLGNPAWVAALSAIGILGTACSVAGFVALAAFLMRGERPHTNG